MSLFLLNTRELRSFKIRKNGLELCESINDKNKSIAFGVSYALYTDNRIQAKEILLNKNLKANLVSIRIFRFLFKTKEWSSIKNLLKGQVFLIKPVTTDSFNREDLKFILNSNQFLLRLLLNNQIFYRKNRLSSLINQGLDFQGSKIKITQNLNFSKIKLLKKIAHLALIK